MIQNICNAIKKMLPAEEQDKIEAEARAAPLSTGEPDTLDPQLLHLFNHLLGKTAQEVDALISKAFKINLDAPPPSAPITPSHVPAPVHHVQPRPAYQYAHPRLACPHLTPL